VVDVLAVGVGTGEAVPDGAGAGVGGVEVRADELRRAERTASRIRRDFADGPGTAEQLADGHARAGLLDGVGELLRRALVLADDLVLPGVPGVDAGNLRRQRADDAVVVVAEGAEPR